MIDTGVVDHQTEPGAGVEDTPLPVMARLAEPVGVRAAEGVKPPRAIMWMPAGTHTIHATLQGNPVKRTITVTPETASVMQAALERELRTGHRPLIDFDHAHAAAAAWPTRYFWEEGRGVMVELEWSEAGAAAVTGKTHRAFSPEFFPDAQGRVIGAPKHHGSLVNDPAFTAIAPIWAAAAKQPNQETMAKDTTDKTDRADQTDRSDSGTAALRAQHAEAQAALTAAKAEAEALKAKHAEAQQALQAARREKAEAAVQAAVDRGALPALDKPLQAKWAGLLEADPDNAKLLAALPDNPALKAGKSGAGTGIESRPGLVEALQAYQAARPSDRGAIYAKEIRPALDKGAILGPILAANSLGGLSGDLVVQRALTLLKLEFPFLTAISTDFSAERAAFNQTIKTRLRTPPAVTDYNPVTGYATSDATTTDVPVTIDNHKAVQISFNANELASTERDLFGEQAEGCQYALGKAMCDALFGRITAANYSNVTTKALASFGRPDLTAMAKALYDRGVSGAGRFVLLNSAYFEALQGDPTIVSLAAYQRPEIITGYTLPPIAGLQPYQAVNLPSTGNLTGFAGTPDSLCLATRLPNDYSAALPGASGGGTVATVTNPDTGISVMLVQFVNHQLGAAFWRVAVMFGTAVGNPASGQRLRSAA
jgi:phage I-like protein